MVTGAAAAAARMRGRNRAGGDGGEDKVDASEVRWLISYSDYMMQLVCLFILLYAVSSVSDKKVREVEESLRKYWDLPLRGKHIAQDVRPPVRAPRFPVSSPVLAEFMEKLEAYGGADEVPVDAVPIFEGIKISVRDARFEEGSAEIPPSMEGVLQEVAKNLAAHPATRVEIRGHTSVSASDAANGDPWLLSYQRARAVAFRLQGPNLKDPWIAWKRLRIAGCAFNEPADPNALDAPAGSAADRRVEIVVTEERVDKK